MDDPHDPVAAIRGLKADFLRGSPKRLATIDAQLARLKESPGDRAALQSLRTELRSLASLGRASGFPKVSRLSQEGESRCGRVAKAASPEDLEALESTAAAIRSELSEGPGGEPVSP
jgi:hypothetical protein